MDSGCNIQRRRSFFKNELFCENNTFAVTASLEGRESLHYLPCAARNSHKINHFKSNLILAGEQTNPKH